MGLSLLSSASDPRQQLESLQRELYNRNRELAEVQEALRQERAKNAATERGAQQLREILSPMFNGLKMVFGEMEGIGISSTVPDSRVTAVWNDWKQKLGGHTAKAIDVLLLHGSMNRTQLRLHLRCATGTVVNVVAALNKAGLINKNGDQVSLKEL